MQPLDTKVYLLKSYSPSDSFCFWECSGSNGPDVTLKMKIVRP